VSTRLPSCRAALRWLRTHKGRGCFAPFTGQDAAAWDTFRHALDLWAYGDDAGRRHAVEAMRAAVAAMQPHVRHLARDVIPECLDWGDIVRLWPRIDTSIPILDGHTPKVHRAELSHLDAQGRAPRRPTAPEGSAGS
jgi:hypothetical protein